MSASNPPSGSSGIPMNAPRPTPGHVPAPPVPVATVAPMPAQSPYDVPTLSPVDYAPLNAPQNSPVPSNPYAISMNVTSLNGTTLEETPLNGSGIAPGPYAPLIAPGQYPSTPGGTNPYPPQASPYASQIPNGYGGQAPSGYGAQLPSGYQVPGQMPNSAYSAPQNTEYRPLSSAGISDGPNIGMGVVVGVILAIACGLGFGFMSVAVGFRIPYLSLGIGYVIGYAVLHASKENGDVQGIVGGVCSLLACLLGLGMMYLNNIYISPLAYVFAAFATYRGYAIAADI